jgi:Uracil DNA glycosylase superfamily
MQTFALQILSFYKTLKIDKALLPHGIEVMNPYLNKTTWQIVEAFYTKFYNDNRTRKLILGINPGRHGAGLTGIPFTDTKRLNKDCGIAFSEFESHETSSVFVYDMINAFGGAKKFYKQFYISSVSPLGFIIKNKSDKFVNYNYYDSKELENALKSFVIETIQKQIDFGIDTSECYCLGTGKNFKYLTKLNAEFNFFKEIIPLEHPRYVMQYKSKLKDDYIQKYLDCLL